MFQRNVRVIAATSFAITLLAGVVVYKVFFEPKPKTKETAAVAQSVKADATDSDQDGLRDWEEELWQTDKNIKDTDGDGTLDGEEVRVNRNPRIKGPKDSLDQKEQETASTSKPLTNTDIFARDVFAKYIALKQSGGEIDADTQEQLVQAMLVNANGSLAGRTYYRTDLRVTPNSDTTSLLIYGNAVGQAVTDSFSNKNRSELDIIKDSMQLGDEDILKELDPIIKEYTNFETRLKGITVPEAMVISHIKLLNHISEFTAIIKGMRVAYTDPISMLFAARQYPYTAKALYDDLVSLLNELNRNGVGFTTTDPGYALIILVTPSTTQVQ